MSEFASWIDGRLIDVVAGTLSLGRPHRIGVALSGGGARGFAHGGALLALEEAGFRPDLLAGVSAGSVAAVMYGSGMRPEQIVTAFAGRRFTDLCEFAVPRDGLFTMEGFKRLIRDNVGIERLEDLPLATVVCATDMDHNRAVAFEKGNVADCVAASCSLPVVFKPQVIGGVRYLDGGVLHNLPAWAVRERCGLLIGINCSAIPKRHYRNSIADIAQASYNMAVKGNVRPDMELCDICIELGEIADYSVFNLRDIQAVFRKGYEATRRALADVSAASLLKRRIRPERTA